MIKQTLFALCLSFASSASADTDIRAWSKAAKPTTSKISQSIGKYTAGCLRGAATLPQNGTGYQVMRLSRNRYYGHPNLLNFIQNLGQQAQAHKLGTLLIGDLGQARGGPTLTGHRSHQTGLDVDIWYLLAKDAAKRQLSHAEREQWGAPSVLTPHADDINPLQWLPANERVLEAAARMEEVDRIFVNAYVKKALCKGKADHAWLQKIRPWHGHADHFHVRLRCPAGDSHCETQGPVPAGDGCGADLVWWFSAEAKKPAAHPPRPPALPKECDAVLVE